MAQKYYFLLVMFVVISTVLLAVAQAFSTNFDSEDFPSPSELATFELKDADPADNENNYNDNSTDYFCSNVDSKIDADDLARNALTAEDRQWETFRFYISSNFRKPERRRIGVVISIMHAILPCVKFEELDDVLPEDKSHVYIQTSDICAADVGKYRTRQEILLHSGCRSEVKRILHEFMHSFGLDHEQNRPDRDEYVNIHWENVEPAQIHNFEKTYEPEYSTFDVPYNKMSVMHYSTNAFSTNGKATMSFKASDKYAPNEPISFGPFEDIGLQKTDVIKLRKMYRCGYIT